MPKRKNTSSESVAAKRLRVDHAESEGSAQNGASLSATALRIAEQLERGQPKLRSERKGKQKKAVVPETRTIQSHKVATDTAIALSGRKETIHKLAPPRPFPTVPSSVSASGPKSAHSEGKNLICITRHTPLAAYLSRCRKILVDDGYKILHLHAMGAAIPHLLILTVSLPPILPYSSKETKIEVRTGTIEVMDEIIPEDENEDMSLRTRFKGGVSVVIRIGDEKAVESPVSNIKQPTTSTKDKKKSPKIVVIREQEQDDEMDEVDYGDETVE